MIYLNLFLFILILRDAQAQQTDRCSDLTLSFCLFDTSCGCCHLLNSQRSTFCARSSTCAAREGYLSLICSRSSWESSNPGLVPTPAPTASLASAAATSIGENLSSGTSSLASLAATQEPPESQISTKTSNLIGKMTSTAEKAVQASQTQTPSVETSLGQQNEITKPQNPSNPNKDQSNNNLVIGFVIVAVLLAILFCAGAFIRFQHGKRLAIRKDRLQSSSSSREQPPKTNLNVNETNTGMDKEMSENRRTHGYGPAPDDTPAVYEQLPPNPYSSHDVLYAKGRISDLDRQYDRGRISEFSDAV